MKLFEVAIPDSPNGYWAITKDGKVHPERAVYEPEHPQSILWQGGVNIDVSIESKQVYVECCRYLPSAAKQSLLKLMSFVRNNRTIQRAMVDLYLVDNEVDDELDDDESVNPDDFLTPLGEAEIFSDCDYSGPKAMRQAMVFISQMIQPLEAAPDRDW